MLTVASSRKARNLAGGGRVRRYTERFQSLPPGRVVVEIAVDRIMKLNV